CLVCSGILLALVGCAKDAEELEDPVLAEVGDRRITASQLIDFEQRLPEQLKTKKSGLDGYRDYLQTVIDKEIFLQEAIKRGLDEAPEVAQKLQREKAERVLSLLFEREFLAKIHVDEQELRAAYEAADKEREVKLRLIIVDTQAEAEEIGQSLADGRDFAELAHSRSQHKSTAPQGGELDGYLPPKRIPVYLQEYINALAVGEYSEPIRLPNDQFGIYQVMHSRPVSFATASNELEAKLREEKTTELIEVFLAQLRADIDLQANAETLYQLQQWVAAERREYTEAERAGVLFQFRDGSVTVGDFWDYAAELKMGFSGDIAESVRWFAEDVLLPRTLFLYVADERGIDREEQIVRWYERRKDALLLLALRQTAVKDQVHIEPEAVRKLYDERPELFTAPEEVTLQEIMVQTREEAVEIEARIEAGEDMGALADEYTLRTVGKGAQGTFHIHAFEQAFYPELIDAVRNAEVGRLYGPLAVTAQAAQVVGSEAMPRGGEYYSVFKVLKSNFGSAPESFDTAAKRARALLKRAEESRLADAFLMGLRRDYEDGIVVYEDRLKTLLPQ
ncbi:MAG: peptidyl-prolyl cis-trans isomerase, partial [Gemmatimonadetes bacterium]|nr:peptidyl-prolyl cis-trans isomerase [Gemmatimonadota bacterium]